MKNIDTDHVSRSQAKRLSNRLDKFEGVIEEFANVNIKLITLHMNTDVEKMFHHVKGKKQ